MPAIQILDGRTSVWQWDTGVKIKLYGCNDVDQMHFETPEGLISRAAVDDECSVPDSALQTAGMLKMYAYDRNEAGGITRNDFALWVRARPKPADYVDPPDAVDNLQALAERVAQLIPGGGGFNPENAGMLVYIGFDGKLIPLSLGYGLEIANGVLRVTDSQIVKAVCGKVRCGEAVCGEV